MNKCIICSMKTAHVKYDEWVCEPCQGKYGKQLSYKVVEVQKKREEFY